MRWFLLAFMVFFFLACAQKTENLPIEEERLVQVLADVHIAEAALQNLRGEVKDSVANEYYSQIYDIHGVSEEEFKETMTILRENPKILEHVYIRVLNDLSIREAKATGAKSTE